MIPPILANSIPAILSSRGGLVKDPSRFMWPPFRVRGGRGRRWHSERAGVSGLGFRVPGGQVLGWGTAWLVIRCNYFSSLRLVMFQGPPSTFNWGYMAPTSGTQALMDTFPQYSCEPLNHEP